MMHFNLIFKKYDWVVHVYILFEDSNIKEIIDKLEYLNCPNKIIRKALDRIINYQNSGFTYTNPDYRESIIVINLPDSINELVDTYNHEKNHVEMHICKLFGISPYSEEAAYLSGELAEKLFKGWLKSVISKFI